MKLLKTLFKTNKKVQKTLEDYKEELIAQQGKEQFKKLLDKGLGVPIALL